MKDSHAHQVNLSTTEGDIGVLSGHVPSILQLRPGLIEILHESNDANSQKIFASGGFATVNADSSMQIAAIEAAPLDHIDLQLVKDGMADLQKTITSSSSASENIRTILQIQMEVYQALYNGLIKQQK